MFYYFDPMYFLFAIPGLLVALWAQSKVKYNYAKYSNVFSSRGITGEQAAQSILRQNGITNVSVMPISGKLTDNFNPKDNTIYLSEGVFSSNSISAVGIAAHETGHALQHAFGYTPIKLRSALVPVCNFGAGLSPFLILVGYLMNMSALLYAALAMFLLSVIFQLVTLPVEFNASSRAIQSLENQNILNDNELKGAKKVLSAAALTYVAALLQSLLIFLYYFVRFTGNRRD